MSYTTKIKNEISEKVGSRSEIIAELSGFIRNNGEVRKQALYLTTENLLIASRIVNFFQTVYGEKVNLSEIENLNFSKRSLYQLTLSENLNFILKDLGILSDMGSYLENPPDYLVDSHEEMRAYIRGVFLATGSVNDPKTSRYHLELFITKKQEAVFVQRILNQFLLNAKILTRDKGVMIYLKEADKISDFLKILAANKAVLYFEDIRAYREAKNQANRLNNCEQANMDKIVSSAAIQLNYIDVIEEKLSVDLLDDKTKEALEYRKKYPEASLKELSEIISMETGKAITKSGLNHRFRKIKELALKLQEK